MQKGISIDETKVTKLLLTAGAIAGPIYLFVGLAQALTRSGFNITRHASACSAMAIWVGYR